MKLTSIVTVAILLLIPAIGLCKDINFTVEKCADGEIKITEDRKQPEEIKIHGTIPSDFQDKGNWREECLRKLVEGEMKKCTVGKAKLIEIWPTIKVAPSTIYELSLKGQKPNFELNFEKLPANTDEQFIRNFITIGAITILFIQAILMMFTVNGKNKFWILMSCILTLMIAIMTALHINDTVELPSMTIARISLVGISSWFVINVILAKLFIRRNKTNNPVKARRDYSRHYHLKA